MTFSARTLTYTIPLVTVLRKAGLFTFAGSLRSVEIEVINYPDCENDRLRGLCHVFPN